MAKVKVTMPWDNYSDSLCGFLFEKSVAFCDDQEENFESRLTRLKSNFPAGVKVEPIQEEKVESGSGEEAESSPPPEQPVTEPEPETTEPIEEASPMPTPEPAVAEEAPPKKRRRI